MKVKDVMEHPVQSCGPNANLQVIGKMMSDHDCGAILVVDGSNQPIGIVTDRDIVMVAALTRKRLWDIQSSEATHNREVYTCNIDDEPLTALKYMEQHKVRRMPVVDENNKLQGIITIDDLVHLAQERDELLFHQTINTLKAVSKHH